MKIIYNRLLGGWYIVRGAHQTPIGGRFDSKAAAEAHLRSQTRLRGKPIDKNTWLESLFTVPNKD